MSWRSLDPCHEDGLGDHGSRVRHHRWAVLSLSNPPRFSLAFSSLAATSRTSSGRGRLPTFSTMPWSHVCFSAGSAAAAGMESSGPTRDPAAPTTIPANLVTASPSLSWIYFRLTNCFRRQSKNNVAVCKSHASKRARLVRTCFLHPCYSIHVHLRYELSFLPRPVCIGLVYTRLAQDGIHRFGTARNEIKTAAKRARDRM